jgi:hypothetical protein
VVVRKREREMRDEREREREERERREREGGRERRGARVTVSLEGHAPNDLAFIWQPSLQHITFGGHLRSKL